MVSTSIESHPNLICHINFNETVVAYWKYISKWTLTPLEQISKTLRLFICTLCPPFHQQSMTISNLDYLYIWSCPTLLVVLATIYLVISCIYLPKTQQQQHQEQQHSGIELYREEEKINNETTTRLHLCKMSNISNRLNTKLMPF